MLQNILEQVQLPAKFPDPSELFPEAIFRSGQYQFSQFRSVDIPKTLQSPNHSSSQLYWMLISILSLQCYQWVVQQELLSQQLRLVGVRSH